MYIDQLADSQRYGPLETGFANGAEAVVAGWPGTTYSEINYLKAPRDQAPARQNWLVLAKQLVATHQATPLGKLLQMEYPDMLPPHYAEGWTLVGLLNKQPVKFGKLLLALRKGGSELAAIKNVYGWDEKKLTAEWRTYVLRQK